MGFRPGGNRAAWSHALHDKQQQQQQRENSRREQIWVFRQLDIPATSRGGGGRSGHHGGVFVRVNNEFVFTMGTPVDRNYCFGRTK